eukprot:g1687.t1
MLYGTAWKKGNTTSLVYAAIHQGFRGIDTACQPKHYREDLVGAALAKIFKPKESSSTLSLRRSDIFLQTKFTSIDGQDTSKALPYDPEASLEDQVKQSLQTSLKNLQTDYIDSLVMHGPMRTYKDTLRVWRMFENFVASGHVKEIGISNCYDERFFFKLYEEAKVKPSVLQNRFYSDTGFDVGLRKFCLENNIKYQSFWTLTANPDFLDSKQVKLIAEKHQKSKACIFYRALIQLGIYPLSGTTSVQHMREDVEVASDGFTLSDREVKLIAQLFQ